MRRRSFYQFVAALTLAGYGCLGWDALSAHYAGPRFTLCLVKAVTGLPCPSCGITRSIEAFAAGDLLGSLLTNPLGVILAALLMIVPVWATADALRKTDSLYRMYAQSERSLCSRPWLAAASIALVAMNWVWNIAKGL